MSGSIRLAHVADLHLGSGCHLGDEDRGGVNSRLRDFRDAWVRSCEQMVAERVDLVLFAGDAFRDSKPSPTEQQAFRDGLDVLCDVGIPTVIVTGNHDLPRAPGRTHALAIFDGYREWVTVYDRPGTDVYPVRNGSGAVAVACLPWFSRAHIAAGDPDFERLTLDEQNGRIVDLSLAVLRKLGAEVELESANEEWKELADEYTVWPVLVAHGSIAGSVVGAEGSTAFFREPVLPLSELRGLPFAYQAWGHLHRAQELDPRISYSGSIERTDFAETNEDKGWWLITLGEETHLPEYPGLHWRSSSPRTFVDLDLPDPTAWETLDMGLLDERFADAIVRVSYTATPEIARTIDHAAIRRALYAAGALKVHGPIATVRHAVTEAAPTLTEETDVYSGWTEYADRLGLSDHDRERLDRKVCEALEAVTP